MTKKQCENCKFYDEDIDTQPCCSCKNKENFEADKNVGDKIKDKDIIKALECCSISDYYDECRNCFYAECDSDKGCIAELCEDALNLIKNQQAEIEKLKERVHFLCGKSGALQGEIQKYHNALKTVKTEAYKEFAELVKSRMFKGKKYDYERNYIDNLANELNERKGK